MSLNLRVIAAAAAMVFATVGSAWAANVALVSMYYSAAHPVPHIHYSGETEAGDVERLLSIYDKFVHCRTECLGPDGGATAVLTLDGPGGDYLTGLIMAEVLRENQIATVVEGGMECHSACAFAFLGGTGYSSNPQIGNYVDRVIEPGGVVGFHAPYANNDALTAALQEHLPSEILDFNRTNLSLMVRELVRWNVDPEIVFYMVDMGPDQFYYLQGPEDLYLSRTALPPTPTAGWITDIPSAVRNACVRLLAAYDRTNPILVREAVSGNFIDGIGRTETGQKLSGYRLADDTLSLGHCSVLDESIASLDLEVALYLNTFEGGPSLPLLSMFNRQDGFSTAGVGGNAVKRTFQRGALNHWFLPVGTPLDGLGLGASFAIRDNRFFTIESPALPPARAGFNVVAETATSRVSHRSGLWVFEQVGNSRLFGAAVEPNAAARFDYTSRGDTSFVRGGTLPDGTPVTQLGFLDGNSSLVVQAMVLPLQGDPHSAEEIAQMTEVACSAQFREKRLTC